MPISAFGVLAPNAKLRKLVVPEPPEIEDDDPCGHSIAYEQITTGKTIRRRWIPWATMLLKSVRRGCAGLSQVRLADAADCVDHAAESHQRHPRLRRDQATTALTSVKEPEKPRSEPPAITAAGVSSTFSLTWTRVARNKKQEQTHANPLECRIHPLQLSLSLFNPAPPQIPGPSSGPTK